MGLADVCNSLANHIGFFAGRSRSALSSARKKLKDSTNLPDRIRNAMFEKLTRTLYKQAELMTGKLSERLEVIDEVVGPFYEKTNAMSARGPVSENQLWEAMSSIEASKKLADEEKVILVTLFGQIFSAQKPKVVDAVVVEKPTRASAAEKSAALAGSTLGV